MDRWLKYFLVTLCGLQCSTYSDVLWEWRPFGIHSGYMVLASSFAMIIAIAVVGAVALAMVVTRRGFRVSLLAMLLATTGLAISLASVRLRLDHARSQAEAVTSLMSQAEGVASLRSQAEGVAYLRGHRFSYEPRAEQSRDSNGIMWRASNICGIDFFFDVHGIYPVTRDELAWATTRFVHIRDLYADFEMTDEDMLLIGRFPQLTGFMAERSRVTDAGMPPLRHLSGIRYFHLGSSQLTSRASAVITGFSKLETLRLANCDIDDGFVRDIAAMQSLRAINLNGTNVTDEGLATLARSPGIRSIALCRTQITDRGVLALCGHASLWDLSLSGTCISDNSMKCIGPMSQLSYLDVADTEISDRGIHVIEHLENLRYLDIRRTRISDAGARTLLSRSFFGILRASKRQFSQAIIDEIDMVLIGDWEEEDNGSFWDPNL